MVFHFAVVFSLLLQVAAIVADVFDNQSVKRRIFLIRRVAPASIFVSFEQSAFNLLEGTVLEKREMFYHRSAIVLLLLRFGLIVAEDPQLMILLADYGNDDQNGHIHKLNIHHMNISRIPVSVVRPRALDYDHTEGLIYFTDLNTKQIRRVDINGGNDAQVTKLNSTSSPEGLTLDPPTRQVFYTDNGNNLIGRVDMDNFNHTVIVNTGLDKPRGIVADTKNKKLYWVDYGSNPKIETSDYNGTQRSTVIYSDIIDPLEITIDGEGRLYWTEFQGVIQSVSVTGTDRKKLATVNDGNPSHMSIFNGFMYFTYFHDSHLVAVPLDHIDNYATLSSDLLLRPRGIHAFSPNFEVKVPCPYGKHGRDCSICGACKNETVCEKTTGVCFKGCQPGYTTEKCTEKCIPGTFGENCGSQCSENCKSNMTCGFMSGKCPDGCQMGWKGDNCTEREAEQNEGPPIGLIAGVICGVVAAIIIVVVAVYVMRGKRAQKQESDYFSGLSPGNKQANDNYETLHVGGSNPSSNDNANVY